MSCCQSLIGSSASVQDVCTECGSMLSSSPRKSPHSNAAPQQRAPIAKTTREPRKTPHILWKKYVRTEYKVLMIATVPGVSRAKAQAVVDACEGSMARMVGTSSTQLARVQSKGVPIGEELGLAIWRALH